jgi:peptide chain release factor
VSGAASERALLCVTAGRGPAECALAVPLVLREMEREAAAAGLDFGAETGAGASALACVAGEGAAAFARGWVGPLRWIVKSPLRPGHGRKNWFLAVHELTPPAQPPALDPADLRFEALRAGGPGGQHQNTTQSAVRVVHLPSGCSVTARDERSQHRNRALAIERLCLLLGAAAERDRAVAERRDWLLRMETQRGGAARVYEGEAFLRRA